MNPGAKIRISFMGYRDYTEPNEKRIYYSKEFTKILLILICFYLI